MLKGSIKWFNAEKGVGFIKTEAGSEVYLEKENLKNLEKVDEGDVVEFEMGEGLHGPCAIKVKKVA